MYDSPGITDDLLYTRNIVFKSGGGCRLIQKNIDKQKKITDHENSGVGGGYTYKFLPLQFHC